MKQNDARARPRRRKPVAKEDDQPLFLRKAYNMIDTTSDEIGSSNTDIQSQ